MRDPDVDESPTAGQLAGSDHDSDPLWEEAVGLFLRREPDITAVTESHFVRADALVRLSALGQSSAPAGRMYRDGAEGSAAPLVSQPAS